MKVLSYLEYSSKGGIVDIALQIEKLGWDGGVTDFFAQQFKPELVYKYFDIDTDETIESQFFDNIYLLDFAGHTVEIGADSCFYYLNNLATPMPRTLDDFINDCQRAGIELQWKNQNDK